MEIKFYNEAGTMVAAAMNNPHRTRQECILFAQKYLATFVGVASAHVSDDATETLVTKSTEWQKRNG